MEKLVHRPFLNDYVRLMRGSPRPLNPSKDMNMATPGSRTISTVAIGAAIAGLVVVQAFAFSNARNTEDAFQPHTSAPISEPATSDPVEEPSSETPSDATSSDSQDPSSSQTSEGTSPSATKSNKPSTGTIDIGTPTGKPSVSGGDDDDDDEDEEDDD